MNQNHVSIWNWIQKYKPKKVSTKRKRIAEFISNETIIKFSYHFIWLWITIESIQKEMLGISSRFIERNICLLQRNFLKFNQNSWQKFISFNRDRGTWYPPQACKL